MPNSFAQSETLACPRCSQSLPIETWLIVDVDERPDLVARARAGILHDVTCPTCGPLGRVDAPLLLYFPSRDPSIGQPALLFSPSQQSSAEADQQVAGSLLQMLAQRLGDAWQDAWLGEIATVQRALLPVALSNDPAAALQEFSTQRSEEEEEMPPAVAAALEYVLEQLAVEGVEVRSPEELEAALASRPELRARLETALQEIPPDDNPGISADSGIVPDGDLPALINRFLAAATWDESQRIVEAHPELLRDEVDERFALALEEYADNPDAVAMLTTHRALLRRCREAGIACAFAEQMLGADGLAETERLGLASEEFLAQMRARQRSDVPPVPPEFAADLQVAQSSKQHYLHTGDLAALDAAAVAWSNILGTSAFLTSEDGFRVTALNNAAGIFLRCYGVHGRIEDLNRALALWQQAVTLTPPDSPNRPKTLNNLGIGLSDRYTHTGRLEDLEEAIRVSQQAVALTPPDSPDRPGTLNNLGASLGASYARRGRLEDMKEAIRVFQEAVALTLPDSPDRPARLNNLGNGLRARYARTGRLEDLEEAIRVYQQAVTLTPPDSPARSAPLQNLGIGLRDRYAHTGRLVDLEETIGVFQQAVTLTPPDSPDRPARLNHLGIGLRDCFVHTGRLADLEEAIRVFQQAVMLTSPDSPDSPDRPARLNNLGTGLSDRYARTGRLEDLEEAIRVYRQAVAEAPAGSPDLPSLLNNLGTGLSDRYARMGRLEDLEEAILRYRATCELGAAPAPQEVLNVARNWGRWAMQRQAWAEMDEAYSHGLAAGGGLRRRQLRRADKESWMADLQEMAPAAAYAQARLGDPARAAVTLEAGRAQLLAEALEQNRRDLERLPVLGHGKLHERYLTVLAARQRLDQPDAVVADRLVAIEATDQEFDAVIDAIRGVAGYEDFFAEPTFARIQAATQDGPIVYIATTAAGGLALIVHGEDGHKPGLLEKPGLSADTDIDVVWLDDLTDDKVRAWLMGSADEEALGGWLGDYQRWLITLQQAQNPSLDGTERKAAQSVAQAAQAQWLTTMDAVTAELWTQITAPVAAALAGLEQGAAVTLIPGGLLGLLPLHAAWRADATAPTGRRYFLDDFTVRYAPSATALGHAARAAATAGADRLLAIDEPAVADAGRLPNSAREVAAIAGHFTAPTVLAHATATRAAVLAQLADAQVAHFSCHGANDWQDPLASGLLMAGGERLTVADVLGLRLGGARLATLSACETGIPGSKLPDEAVMLPSALLQAGYAGVAASLWSVADISTAMLMAYFYKLWRADGVAPPAALVMAQRWLRDSTNRQKQAFFASYAPELASQLKMGSSVAIEFFIKANLAGGANEHTFAHPFWWSAFYFTGA